MPERRPRARALATIILGIALIGAACASDSTDDLGRFFPSAEDAAADAAAAAEDDGSLTAPPPEELLDPSIAPRTALEAVQKFFSLIAAERFEDAYRLVSLEVRESIDAARFSERYRDIWNEASITSMSYEIVPPPGENVAGIEVIVRYESTFFGPIEERVFAATRRQPNWTVEWSPALIFVGLDEPDHLVHRFVEVPERGNIFDRSGVPLATQGQVAVVGVAHDLIDDIDAVIELLVEQLELDEETVRDLIFQDVPSYFFIPVARLPYDAHPDVIADFEQRAAMGILVQRETRRVYPQDTLASHVIGFLAEINEEELAERAVEGYRPGDMVGRDGVEAIFEDELAGQRGGLLTIIGPGGSLVREIAARSMDPAQDVYLTIDVRVQRIAEFALEDRAGAIVVLDPRSQELLALASYPRFDPNAFIRGLTDEEFTRYFEDELQPFVNRPVERLYPPGSVFKVVTLAAGLEAGGFDAASRLDCPAVWTGLGEETPLRNWKEEDSGFLSLEEALAESCNSVFYQIGAALHSKDEGLLSQFASGFGFGRSTGIVGLNDAAGVNPGPDWKRVNRNDFWYTGDTVNMSIGQGFLLVTPLQITIAYAAMATDGIVRTPLAVQAVRTADGETVREFEAESIGVLPVSAETLDYLQGAARLVISSRRGTGWVPFNGSALAVAGKSGTAEDREEQSHALFVAYANIGDPSLIVTVVLEDGESGADDAGPIARRILESTLLSGIVF